MTTAYISVKNYFPQFKEYIVMTNFKDLEEIVDRCTNKMGKSQIRSFEDNGKHYVGIMDGKDEVKSYMECMKKEITKYTLFMINHLRETNDERYTTWNNDIAWYVAYNSVINQKPIVLIDPSCV
tara:strand:- start:219 stop:590 length:372 start_codon:yes stop_codon:yes gene_type:complete